MIRSRCSTCGQPLLTAVDPEELERACRERGHLVTSDGRVNEQVAAELLNRSVRTLEDWARDGRIPVVRANRRRTYRLSEIARLLDEA
ncbi:helix-turn-helix domain-containing protein [Lysobacter firmicutimachus]|uniref:Helix-turn-helix domain-containing protein n=1 Tax=Lysobacter firmicutimachus TaxID=1792846 RepID=A0AAU8MWH8_9GAMM